MVHDTMATNKRLFDFTANEDTDITWLIFFTMLCKVRQGL